MATIAAGSSFTVTMAPGTVLDVSGNAEITFGAGRYETLTGEGRYGPYLSSVTAVIKAISAVTFNNYYLTSQSEVAFDSSSTGGKIDGLVNGDGSIIPIVNLKYPILEGASAGTSSDWIPISPFPERLAYALDSGSTTTTFSIDVSADGGVTTLSQAFTGSYASSSVAEVTYPILYSALTATHFRINVLTGGPISFNRGS